MKRILMAVLVVAGTTSVYASEVSATAADYMIDCSQDTDPSQDNTSTVWADYSGGTVTVLTTNCTFSCAMGMVDQVTSCTSAFGDFGSPRTFIVSGPGYVHAYSPGTFGVDLRFGALSSDLNLTAVVEDENLKFSWDLPPTSDVYSDLYTVYLERHQGINCSSISESNCSIALGDLPRGSEFTFFLRIGFDFDGGYMDQDRASSTDVDLVALTPTTTAAPTTTGVSDTLVPTGTTSVPATWFGLALIALGATTMVLRRRETY